MKFSIITVALNPGEKLWETLESVFCQTYTDYEVILKDGGSTDGSMDFWRGAADCAGGSAGLANTADCAGGSVSGWPDAADRVRFLGCSDTGIYDAMNQAVRLAEGDFVLFLNCGDRLADATVLERVAECARRSGYLQAEGHTQTVGNTRAAGHVQAEEHTRTAGSSPLVIYGDTIGEGIGALIASAPKITGFTCYRNIPCHQSCFYSIDLCRGKSYDLRYRIRADYDHFLWCYYRAGAKFLYTGFPVASYEGRGYSENRRNAERDKAEHRAIAGAYMSALELFGYRAVMALTLAPLRSRAAQSRLFAGIYHRVKRLLFSAAAPK